jgi:hypothetical protein
MKRSEALDIIDTVLYEHELPLLQGIDKEILGMLERAGMLPPHNKTAQAMSGSVTPSVGCCQWEPEDE